MQEARSWPSPFEARPKTGERLRVTEQKSPQNAWRKFNATNHPDTPRVTRLCPRAGTRRNDGRALGEGKAREDHHALRRRPGRLPRPLDPGFPAKISRRHRRLHRRLEQPPPPEEPAA